jgi:hypothetical protein
MPVRRAKKSHSSNFARCKKGGARSKCHKQRTQQSPKKKIGGQQQATHGEQSDNKGGVQMHKKGDLAANRAYQQQQITQAREMQSMPTGQVLRCSWCFLPEVAPDDYPPQLCIGLACCFGIPLGSAELRQQAEAAHVQTCFPCMCSLWCLSMTGGDSPVCVKKDDLAANRAYQQQQITQAREMQSMPTGQVQPQRIQRGFDVVLGQVMQVDGQAVQGQVMQVDGMPVEEANPMSDHSDAADRILKLKGLLDAGAITQDEFDKKKAELLKLC